jgi:23S rRNA (adenine1618-N6)-methyltransferase
VNKNNPHTGPYDLNALSKALPGLKPFVFTNRHGNITVDFSDPDAVKMLNRAILKKDYGIKFWEFSSQSLVPPIPGRVDYLCELNDILEISGLQESAKIFDIGTGANCIYPILGTKMFNWEFLASDASSVSVKEAKLIVDTNHLNNVIKVRLQENKQYILKNVLNEDEKITASICNPPFYKNKEDAIKATTKKWRGLKQEVSERNFGGQANELWYKNGEKGFIQNYIYDSSFYKENCAWFTCLVSDKDLLRPLKVTLKKYNPAQVKVIKMKAGNKVSHMLLWSYLNEEELKVFKL